jgi:hypothetical protein
MGPPCEVQKLIGLWGSHWFGSRYPVEYIRQGKSLPDLVHTDKVKLMAIFVLWLSRDFPYSSCCESQESTDQICLVSNQTMRMGS